MVISLVDLQGKGKPVLSTTEWTAKVLEEIRFRICIR